MGYYLLSIMSDYFKRDFIKEKIMGKIHELFKEGQKVKIVSDFINRTGVIYQYERVTGTYSVLMDNKKTLLFKPFELSKL